MLPWPVKNCCSMALTIRSHVVLSVQSLSAACMATAWQQQPQVLAWQLWGWAHQKCIGGDICCCGQRAALPLQPSCTTSSARLALDMPPGHHLSVLCPYVCCHSLSVLHLVILICPGVLVDSPKRCQGLFSCMIHLSHVACPVTVACTGQAFVHGRGQW